MKIDLSCPVELWSTLLPTDTSKECRFMIGNLSPKMVVSVQATISYFDVKHLLKFRQTERIRGLHVETGQPFSFSILPNREEPFSQVELLIEKVWFDDASVWRRGNEPLHTYTSNQLPLGRDLEELKFVVGSDAIGYPYSTEQLWICTCGRPNLQTSDKCVRCKRKKEIVFQACTPENVKKVVTLHEKRLVENAKRALVDSSNKEEKIQQTAQKKHKRNISFFKYVVVLLLILLVAAAFWFLGKPAIQYFQAEQQLSNGQYDDARNSFMELLGYRDADEKIIRCDYEKALAYLEKGDITSLNESAALFLALDDYQDSKDLYSKARLATGKALLQEKKYEEAAVIFRELDDYDDAKALLDESIYQQALALMEVKNYNLALVLLEDLQHHSDAIAQIQQCYFEIGKESFDNGEYLKAYDTLSKAPLNDAAIELKKESAYRYALEQYELNNIEVAGNYYLLAENYGDSAARAKEALYQFGHSLMEDKNYEKASGVFLQIYDYLDSSTLHETCLIEQARNLADNEDWLGAIALLEGIEYNSSAEGALQEYCYYIANNAIENEDFLLAERQLKTSGSYKDSEKLLKEVMTTLADSDFDKGNYAQALIRYEELEHKRVSECHYNLGNQSLENDNPDEALIHFEAAGNYKDSKDKRADIVLQQAVALRKESKVDEALALLDTVSYYDKALDEKNDLLFSNAQKLFDEKSYEESAAAYKKLGNHPEAVLGYNRSIYAQADALMQENKFRDAATLFASIEDYEDAKSREDSCYIMLYGDILQPANSAIAKKDYATVINLLANLPTTDLPEEYQELPNMYKDACYQLATQYAKEDKPYIALPLYLRIKDYKDVETKKLTRTDYTILGDWEARTGEKYSFKADGTATINDKDYVFELHNYGIHLGENADNTKHLLTFSSQRNDVLTLVDFIDGTKKTVVLQKINDADFSADALLPVPGVDK